MREAILLVFCVFATTSVSAQDSIQYTPDFEFYDGLYLSFEDFRHDNPIPFESVVSNYSVDDPMLLEKMLVEREIVYVDRFEDRHTISINDLWGYSRRGKPFIAFKGMRYMGKLSVDRSPRKNEDSFGQFIVIGQLCVFQINLMTYRYVDRGTWDTNQLFFSIKDQKAIDYNGPEFEKLIADDPDLLAEFQKLNLRQKKERMFSYVQRYNQRHPLYFPFFGE